MKYLKDLLYNLEFKTIINYNPALKIYSLEQDSRIKSISYLFFAKKGKNIDSHDLINQAIENGAKCIIAQYLPKNLIIKENIVYIVPQDYIKAKAIITNRFFDFIFNKLNIIAITGTNGKTTSTYMLETIFKSLDKKTGIIGTIKYKILDKEIKAINTTPDILQLNKLLFEMQKNKVEYVFMEVSSHALQLGRVEGIKFNGVIFTNLTQDHLDFHINMQNYFKAKLQILNNLKDNGYIITNNDCSYFSKIDYKNKLTYSINNKNSDLYAYNIKTEINKNLYNLKYKNKDYKVKLNIGGLFNIYNSLGVIGASIKEGISIDEIIKGLEKLNTVEGRFELLKFKDFNIIIDYAHTPNGLENLLKSVNTIKKSRIITVFGAGGDRDRKKRPKMGAIAYNYSDIIIITSDNPRTEDPLKIIQDIKSGIRINGKNIYVIENRKQAIKKSIEIAKRDDIIVIAGKGHENYQIIGKKRIHFSDKEEVENLLNEKNYIK